MAHLTFWLPTMVEGIGCVTMATNDAYVNGILNVKEQLQKCWVADLDWSLLPENVRKVRNATTHAAT